MHERIVYFWSYYVALNILLREYIVRYTFGTERRQMRHFGSHRAPIILFRFLRHYLVLPRADRDCSSGSNEAAPDRVFLHILGHRGGYGLLARNFGFIQGGEAFAVFPNSDIAGP